MELRCQNRLHGHIDDGVLEISCRSKFCGKAPGNVIIHRFNLVTGELIETKRFKDPVKEMPETGALTANRRDALGGNNGSRNRIPVWHP